MVRARVLPLPTSRVARIRSPVSCRRTLRAADCTVPCSGAGASPPRLAASCASSRSSASRIPWTASTSRSSSAPRRAKTTGRARFLPLVPTSHTLCARLTYVRSRWSRNTLLSRRMCMRLGPPGRPVGSRTTWAACTRTTSPRGQNLTDPSHITCRTRAMAKAHGRPRLGTGRVPARSAR